MPIQPTSGLQRPPRVLRSASATEERDACRGPFALAPLLLRSLALGALMLGARAEAQGAGDPPNILVIVVDDLGIDQMSFPPFGWNAAPEAPSMPVLAEIASRGVSFRNFWATPECSPSRAAMLTGRHSFRTGVVTAIVDPMLPAIQLHPSEVTLPKLLRPAGYVSGMLGKYHLGGGPENTPPGFGFEAPSSTVGLDFYDGYWDLPPSIDTTLGGQAPVGTFDCGAVGGIGITCAACFPDGSCVEGLHPLDAMAIGATPMLAADGTLATTCANASCAGIDYTLENAYYAWSRVVASHKSAGQLAEPHREYLTSFVSRRSVEWIESARAAGKPWLAFSTHSSAHTPIQPPPPTLTGPAATGVSCALTGVGFRLHYKLMAESVDRSIGNMLVDLGLGSFNQGVFTLGDLAAANTMLVVVNDNGTYALNVLPPFSPGRSKQTVYETGVRSPCIIAGKGVNAPGRAVDAAVSIVDLFGLIADAAGVDWTQVAGPGRVIDCRPMTPYLVNPKQEPIRDYQFAMYSQGEFATGQVGPCLVAGAVIDGLITSPQLCADNGGCWLGGANTAPYPVSDYCGIMTTDLDASTITCGGVTYCALPPSMADQCPAGLTPITPPTVSQYATRTGPWKLVVQALPECLAPNDCSVRLYNLPEPVAPTQPGIEPTDGSPGVWDPFSDPMPDDAAQAYIALKEQLVSLLLSERHSPADGNLDGVVDGADLANLLNEWGSMGFWDATRDGVVDAADLTMLFDAWGPVPASTALVPPCIFSDIDPIARDYLFDTGLADSSASGVRAVSLGGTVAQGAYAFSDGQGLQVPVAGEDWSDFDISMRVHFDGSEAAPGKLVDLFDRTEDRGLYRAPSGELFQLLPPAGPMSPKTVPIGSAPLIRYARDGASSTVSLWINGELQWSQSDPKGLAIPPADGVVTFFSDDTVTGSQENFTGRVDWIRIRSSTAR